MPSLRHASDGETGYTRRRRGRGFQYLDHRGRAIRDERTLRRLRSLAVPPAWRDVWLCRSGRGHLQATGIDAAGRKQYLYHPGWREDRDRAKHERILEFADALPDLRRTVARHLRNPDLDRDKALAAAVRLLDRSWIRVGGERYAEDARTYGLATLRSRHVEVAGDTIAIDFEAKGGKRHTAEVRDPVLAEVVSEMDDLPGYEVLSYRDADGAVVDVRSSDINAYIKRHTGHAYTAKDFRTWAATVAAAVALDGMDDVPLGRRRERAVATACRIVSEQLNNTPAVCRRSYIDPRVVAHYLDGRTVSGLATADELPRRPGQSTAERAVLALLHREAD